jgi:trans-feruloyl-CoA hydratase/vanillin synthase
VNHYQTILVEKQDGITTVRFNRPEKRNAMNVQMHREMHDVLSELEFDEETQVLVLTGQGESFCAGQDLKDYFYDLRDNYRARQEIQRISHAWRYEKLRYFPRPTIAAINGYCFGGAFTPVVSVDIAIAADEATFGLSEVNFGQIPAGIVTKAVQEVVLPRQALYYIMTGEPFDGRKAEAIGLVTMSVPRAELDARVLQVAKLLQTKDPEALRACKEAFKAVTPNVGYEDARLWLAAKTDQVTFRQKKSNWMEHGIGQFVKKAYKPGLGAAPTEQ